VLAASALTPDQALEMLGFLGWASLETAEDIDLAIGLLTQTIAALRDGTITDPLTALTDAYNAELTPDGIVNAIGKAEALDETISQVQALVASGIPPGIVLRVTKDALRNGEDPAEALAAFADAYGDPSDPSMSPGQAANQATGRGNQQDKEEDQEDEKKGSKGNGNGKDNKGGKKK